MFELAAFGDFESFDATVSILWKHFENTRRQIVTEDANRIQDVAAQRRRARDHLRLGMHVLSKILGCLCDLRFEILPSRLSIARYIGHVFIIFTAFFLRDVLRKRVWVCSVLNLRCTVPLSLSELVAFIHERQRQLTVSFLTVDPVLHLFQISQRTKRGDVYLSHLSAGDLISFGLHRSERVLRVVHTPETSTSELSYHVADRRNLQRRAKNDDADVQE